MCDVYLVRYCVNELHPYKLNPIKVVESSLATSAIEACEPDVGVPNGASFSRHAIYIPPEVSDESIGRGRQRPPQASKVHSQ